jgi:hypothetical protein
MAGYQVKPADLPDLRINTIVPGTILQVCIDSFLPADNPIFVLIQPPYLVKNLLHTPTPE